MALNQHQIEMLNASFNSIEHNTKIKKVFENAIKTSQDLINFYQSQCDHRFTPSGPLQECQICRLTEKK